MGRFLRDKERRDKFIVLALRDKEGHTLDVRKHPGEWTVEDALVLDRLVRALDYEIEKFGKDPMQITSSHIDAGKRTYVKVTGAGLCAGAVVQGHGWRELKDRIVRGFHAMNAPQLARRIREGDWHGPISAENILSWVIEGDAILPPALRGPRRTDPL